MTFTKSDICGYVGQFQENQLFVGNPMSGPRMMELFMEAVSNLEANGGVYVEPEERY